jgi:hypothetical protein
MSAATRNGQRPPVTHWSQLPVRHFLTTFNWDNRAIELQSPPPERFDQVPSVRPLDLRLTVSQFFGDINWSGAPAAAPALIVVEETSPVADGRGTLTLSDFADLF